MAKRNLSTILDCILQERQFLKTVNHSFLVFTFNIDAKECTETLEIDKFFRQTDGTAIGADFVIVGFQEVVELSTANVMGGALLKGQFDDIGESWASLILKTLNSMADIESRKYELITKSIMVGTFLAVFSSKSHVKLLKNIQVGCVPRGVGNVLGNKGGICARFDIQDTSICVVSAHFSAHRENVTKRNEDYLAIVTHPLFKDVLVGDPSLDKANFTRYSIDEELSTLKKDVCTIKNRLSQSFPFAYQKPRPVSEEISLQATFSPDDHDIVIWCGDLNYRIVEDVEMSSVYEMIDSNALHELALFDQLIQEKECGAVFEDFNEGLLTFPPTYQYINGTLSYDRRPDKKMRCPAWCDRILWRVGKSVERAKSELQQRQNGGADFTGLAGTVVGGGTVLNAGWQKSSQDRFVFSLMEDMIRAPIPSRRHLDTANLMRGYVDSRGRDVDEAREERLSTSDYHNVLQALSHKNAYEAVELMAYESCESTFSDHMPVRAILIVKTKCVDWAARELALIEALNQYLYVEDVPGGAGVVPIVRESGRDTTGNRRNTADGSSNGCESCGSGSGSDSCGSGSGSDGGNGGSIGGTCSITCSDVDSQASVHIDDGFRDTAATPFSAVGGEGVQLPLGGGDISRPTNATELTAAPSEGLHLSLPLEQPSSSRPRHALQLCSLFQPFTHVPSVTPARTALAAILTNACRIDTATGSVYDERFPSNDVTGSLSCDRSLGFSSMGKEDVTSVGLAAEAGVAAGSHGSVRSEQEALQAISSPPPPPLQCVRSRLITHVANACSLSSTQSSLLTGALGALVASPSFHVIHVTPWGTNEVQVKIAARFSIASLLHCNVDTGSLPEWLTVNPIQFTIPPSLPAYTPTPTSLVIPGTTGSATPNITGSVTPNITGPTTFIGEVVLTVTVNYHLAAMSRTTSGNVQLSRSVALLASANEVDNSSTHSGNNGSSSSSSSAPTGPNSKSTTCSASSAPASRIGLWGAIAAGGMRVLGGGGSGGSSGSGGRDGKKLHGDGMMAIRASSVRSTRSSVAGPAALRPSSTFSPHPVAEATPARGGVVSAPASMSCSGPAVVDATEAGGGRRGEGGALSHSVEEDMADSEQLLAEAERALVNCAIATLAIQYTTANLVPQQQQQREQVQELLPTSSPSPVSLAASEHSATPLGATVTESFTADSPSSSNPCGDTAGSRNNPYLSPGSAVDLDPGWSSFTGEADDLSERHQETSGAVHSGKILIPVACIF